MPQVRKFTSEEVQAQLNKGKSPRRMLEERMDQLLADFAVGDYGEMTLEDGELEVTARARIKSAAQRRGLRARFIRSRRGVRLFRLEAGSQQTAPAAAAPATPAKAARGKRRAKG